MKKTFLIVLSLILLGIGLFSGNIAIMSFQEIGKTGGELIVGGASAKGFLKNDFSLWIFVISATLSLLLLISSFLIFPFKRKPKPSH